VTASRSVAAISLAAPSLLVVAQFEVGDDLVRVRPLPDRVEHEERLVGREEVPRDTATERRRREAVDELPLQ